MNKFILALMLLSSQAKATCSLVDPKYWVGNDQIAILVCADMSGRGSMSLDRVRDGWARVLVDRKILYYLKLNEKNWTIVAKGPRFDIDMWEKIGIPSGIR